MNEQSDDPSLKIDDRSPMAKAMSKVSEIVTACLLMVIPALIGIWLDRTLSTVMLFTLLGLVLGVTGSVLQLKRLVGNIQQPQFDRSKIIQYDDEESDEPTDTSD